MKDQLITAVGAIGSGGWDTCIATVWVSVTPTGLDSGGSGWGLKALTVPNTPSPATNAAVFNNALFLLRISFYL